MSNVRHSISNNLPQQIIKIHFVASKENSAQSWKDYTASNRIRFSATDDTQRGVGEVVVNERRKEKKKIRRPGRFDRKKRRRDRARFDPTIKATGALT